MEIYNDWVIENNADDMQKKQCFDRPTLIVRASAEDTVLKRHLHCAVISLTTTLCVVTPRLYTWIDTISHKSLKSSEAM